MKTLLQLFSIAIVACVVVLIFFGAKPADLLRIPVQIFNNIAGKQSGVAGDTAVAAQPSPADAPMPATTQHPSPATASLPPVGEAMARPSAPYSAPIVPNITPKPVEETVDLVALSSKPNEWPKTVVLKAAEQFQIVFNGQVAGSVRVPPGMSVNLIGLHADQAQVQYQGATKLISARSTDLVERVLAARHTAVR